MTGVAIVIACSTAFFGLDALCYFIAVQMQGRALWNNWPGSGIAEAI